MPDLPPWPGRTRCACELIRKAATSTLVVAVLLVAAQLAHAQPAATERVAQPETHAPSPGDATHAGAEEHAEEHGMFAGLLWPTVNFILLCGLLYYFFAEPARAYLRDRHASIRRDLVEAASLRAAASQQLDEIDRRLKALPGELDALRRRGGEETMAEEQRIAAAAAQERQRLLDQARRDIDLQLRIATRELTEHAATLAVDAATRRISREITPADHTRLIDQYVQRVQPSGIR